MTLIGFLYQIRKYSQSLAQHCGVLRLQSTNGGKNWNQVLFVNENTGAADLSIDPSNPRILYAGMWDHQRTPWQVRSGGEGSGIWKSVDGGTEWTKLEGGLPTTSAAKHWLLTTAVETPMLATLKKDRRLILKRR